MGKSLSFWTDYGTEYLGVKPRDVDVGDTGRREAHLTEDAPDRILKLLDGARIAIDHGVTPIHGWDIPGARVGNAYG